MLRLLHRDLFREYRQKAGKNPNVWTPEHINEKYLWRKIFDHDGSGHGSVQQEQADKAAQEFKWNRFHGAESLAVPGHSRTG